MIKSVAVMFLLAFFSSAVSASTTLEDALKTCKSITSEQKRLACFDKVAANLEQTITAQKIENFGKQNSEILDTEEIKTTVLKVKKNPYGELKIWLDNQQVWKQTSGNRFNLKKGDEVLITKGALNSFDLKKVGAVRSIKVKRVK